MKLVIEIDEATYKDIKKGKVYSSFRDVPQESVLAIANGTPLPKGHGRLIDGDRLRSMYSINQANFNTVVGIQKWIDDTPTIIEADTESEDRE